MRARVQALLRACLAGCAGRAEVEALALDLFRWQRTRNPAYAAFCGGPDPASLAAIPAVPVALFREVAFACFPPDQASLRFHTSGTTAARPGVHLLQDSATYDLGSTGWFRACLPNAPRCCLALLPSPAQAPHSSLSHMIALLFPDARWCADADGLIDAAAAWAWLGARREPVFLAATSLAVAALLETPGSCSLASGSVLMTTGGFKGRRLKLDASSLLGRARDRLGGRLALVGEYGMTELCSQLWTAVHPPDRAPPGPEGPFRPPAWLVPVIVAPGTGEPLPTGQRGQIRFVDLANDHSVLAIETMDEGTLGSDGALWLHGRLPGAEARGCSLTAEDALAARLASR